MRLNFEKYGIQIPYGRTGGNAKCHCPQCSEQRHDKRDKSLSVNLGTGMFKCHYCGWEGCAAETDVKEKNDWMKQQPWYKEHQSQIRYQKPTYKTPKGTGSATLSDKAKEWFKSRGISEATLTKMKITEGMEWMPQFEAKRNTVQFNYYHDGKLVNTKFRTGEKKFKLVAGARKMPYNIDAIKGKKDCIITEGEMDALTFIELGYDNVISVPNGANSNLDYLDDWIEDYFDDKDTIYIASDTDDKGTQLRDELLRRFGAERCRVLDYGQDLKDANELYLAKGADAVRKCLETAHETKLEGVFTISDFEQSLDALFENGMQKGVTIGHPNFDRLCSFETKRLCIVTGIPSSGKSEFIDEMAERLNIRYGWRFAYFSPENAPLQYHASKLIEKFTGKHFSKNDLPRNEYQQVKEHMEKDFFFIAPKDNFKLDTILERAKYLVRRKGIKALVIDPYNRLESDQGNRSETLYISETLDKLTNFAQRNDVLIILMAHPTKQPKNKDGVIETPTLYDISGSANFFNKADFGIVVHRDRINNTTEIHVQKVKFRHLGECGTAIFKYNLNNGRYTPFEGNNINPNWDNRNHLIEARRLRDEENVRTSVLPFEQEDLPVECEQQDYFNQNDESCPF